MRSLPVRPAHLFGAPSDDRQINSQDTLRVSRKQGSGRRTARSSLTVEGVSDAAHRGHHARGPLGHPGCRRPALIPRRRARSLAELVTNRNNNRSSVAPATVPLVPDLALPLTPSVVDGYASTRALAAEIAGELVVHLMAERPALRGGTGRSQPKQVNSGLDVRRRCKRAWSTKKPSSRSGYGRVSVQQNSIVKRRRPNC